MAGRTSTCSPTRFGNFDPKSRSWPRDALAELMDSLRNRLRKTRTGPNWQSGPQARVQAAVAPKSDSVMSAIVGVAGLEATYEAIRPGSASGLANKEVLVAGGKLVMDAVAGFGAELIPVDSEHNGAHQCLRAGRAREVYQADPDRFGRSVPQHAGRRLWNR